MKANNGSGNVVERDDWRTPQLLFETLNKQYKFDIDCCATKENRKVGDFYNCFQRSNPRGIFKMAWMNPPFSKAEEMFKHFFKYVDRGIAIYRFDNAETKIWQNVILPNATWVFVPKGRVCYEGHNGSGSRFPSALIGINVEPPENIEGTTLWLR